ncbi:MAG: hypothetical protein FWG10_14345 [Eubacteriaceae bacterium]|nr:hypothetical protein [Eubacteriaceae bacterium]
MSALGYINTDVATVQNGFKYLLPDLEAIGIVLRKQIRRSWHSQGIAISREFYAIQRL